jgi:hypothetical protein
MKTPNTSDNKRFSRRQFLNISLGLSILSLTGFGALGIQNNSLTSRYSNRKKLIADLSSKSIDNFINNFEGQVVLPSNPQYDTLRRIWNYKFDKYPGMITICDNVTDVQKTVSFAAEHELLMSVKSGGHSLAGYSSCDGGIVLDVSKLQGVMTDVTKQRADILGGTTIGNIDSELSKYGMATPGASAATVGYAGFATGGGRGTISPRYGFACDNILELDIVTADGRLKTISSDSLPELFWGVRGGGGNFGVVTRFDVQIHKVPEVVAGKVIFPFKDASDIMKKLRDLFDSIDEDLYVAPILAGTPEGPVLVLNLLYCGPAENAQSVIAPYYAVGKSVTDTVSTVSYLETQAWFPGPPQGTATEGCAGFFPVFTDEIIDSLITSARSGPESFTIPCFSMHGAMADKNLDDNNAYPLRIKGVDFFAMGFWTSLQDRAKTQKWAKELWNSVASATRGTLVNGFFDGNLERARISYLDKYKRLSKLKAVYDSENLFSENVNILPAS